MTIRILVRTDDAGMAANCGGAVETRYKTFDVELPEVERFLREVTDNKLMQYTARQIVGWELLP